MSDPIAKDPARFVETEIDDETVVMSLDSGDFFSLKDSARAIWRLIDGTRDRAAILARLAADFAADEGALAADLDTFLARLGDAGFLARG